MPISLDQAFLQDILARPEDDAPRLIYADWLEEHEQAARAEFIRVQCELARLEEDDARYWPLRSREQELLATHEEAWLAPLRGMGRRWVFRRGFVEEGSLTTGQFLSYAERLFACIPLQHVELARRDGRQESQADYPRVGEMACLARLRGLTLLDTVETAFDFLTTTRHLTGLRELAVQLHTFDSEVTGALAAMPAAEHLRRLEMESWNRRIGALQPLLESPRLKALEALKISLEEPTAPECALLPSAWPLLRRLDISLSRFVSEFLSRLVPAWRHLHELKVSSPELKAEVLPRLVDLLQGGQLRSLSFCLGDRSGDTSAWPSIQRLPSLRRLELPGARVCTEGILHLARSRLLQGLTLLNLQGNISSNAGTRALAELPHLQNLRVLNLRFNGVGDEGVRALARSPIMGNLAYLDLTANRITDRGAEALARSPYLKNLVCLCLPRNAISDRRQEALQERFGRGVCF